MPGCSLNCLRTSSTTVPAERPTARIKNDEARNAIDPPISMPMNVFGLATFISVATCWNSWFPVAWMFNCSPIVWMNAANRATAAITAEPMATPLVIALVVLPTASRLTIIFCGSPSNSPLISAMPGRIIGDRAEGVLGNDDPRRRQEAYPDQGHQVQRQLEVAVAQAHRAPPGQG